MNFSFLKRRYYDVRLGGTAISPAIQMANFIGIAFLYVRDVIPIEVFSPIFFISGILILSWVGKRFRNHQASTDYNMFFERQTMQAAVLYEIMRAIKEKKTDETFDECMAYLNKIKSFK